jgi:NAD(P)-dependent dehydrogenase (short-subunit alcohol dehydrogenase family)
MPERQRVIVTGAAGGIGQACARQLLAEGHSVAGADLQPIPDMSSGAGAFLSARVDVSDEADCRAVVAQCVESFGGVDALIHMAATHSTATAAELDAAEFNRVLSVNVTGAFLMARAAAAWMGRHGGGAIVLAGSGSMNVGGAGGHGRGGPAYVSSKAAIVGLTRSLARSYAPHGIRVNAVSPGATATPMTAGYDEEALRAVAARTLARRIGRPEEIAAVACFLISDAASYVIGEVVQVNGGGSFA